jgi:SAM-dependent methyltransferase
MTNDDLKVEPDRTETAAKRNRFVLSALRRRFGEERILSSALSVLDLGCGGGDLAEALGRAGLHGVFGIDLDAAAVAAARARCGRFGHRFAAMAIEDFNSAPVYDAIVLSEVLTYLRDPRAALSALRRWVQPGGLVVITVANGYGPWALYRSAVERRQGVPPGPQSALGRHRFTARQLQSLCRKAGLRLEAWGRSNFLSAVYPFSVSRYRPERYGFLERWDTVLADLLPRAAASGWYLSLVPASVPSLVAERPRAPVAALGAGAGR